MIATEYDCTCLRSVTLYFRITCASWLLSFLSGHQISNGRCREEGKVFAARKIYVSLTMVQFLFSSDFIISVKIWKS